ncbi:MAG: CoA ester lyase [Nitrospinota bacterium]
MRLFRTILFAPGNRERMLAKVGKAGADAVVLDLEDAVPHSEKEAARLGISGWVERIAADDGAEVFVRVNPLAGAAGLSAAWGAEDIAAAVGPRLTGIVVPKVEDPGLVRAADRLLRERERFLGLQPGRVMLIAILENARGVERAFDIASADVGDRGFLLAFGAGDYTADLGCEWPRDEFVFDYPRARIAGASRAAGRERPLDTVWIRLDDPEGLAASAARARAHGMFGKFCIHPRQVAAVNEAFTPTEADLAGAREIVIAFGEATARGEASVSVNGRMVDYPVVAAAERAVALAEVFGTRKG